MTRTITRLLVPAAMLAVLAVGLPGLAKAGPPEPPVPTGIVVPDGNRLFLVGHAVGVQIHECIPAATGYRWRFAGPRADLYGDNGQLLATHFAGPRWQASDGSTILATLDGDGTVTVDPTAIPWLRLSASGMAGPDGARFADTTWIQRVATVGGLTPAAADCNEATAGTRQEIPYSADYRFWKADD